MRYFFNALKTSMVFVGAVIGAGFASGKEINLFFGTTGIFAPIFSGVISGIFSVLFLFLGKMGKGKFLHNSFFEKLVFIAGIISFGAMCAGSDIILKQLGISFGGVMSAGLVMLAVWFGFNKVSVVNAFLQPTSILLIIILLFTKGNFTGFGNLGFFNAIFYSGMNMLIAGYVLEEMGKKLSKREIIISGVVTVVVMSFLTLAVYFTIRGATGEMPLLTVAKDLGLGALAGIVIYISIITTMVFSAYVIFSKMADKMNKLSALVIISAISAVSVLIGFDHIVNFGYPVVSVMGIIVTLITAFVSIRAMFGKKQLLLK